MRIDDIDALLATVQFSSLNQAAEYLGITQSAITRRLQRLEQTLNVTLLERQTRPLTLTAAGHRVYEQCLSIKRETKKLYGLLDPEAEPQGVLRLGVPQSVAEIALQPALSALRQQFPALEPQVTCGWSGLLQKRLESVELDGVLAMGPQQQRFADGYSGRLLCPLDIVVIAAKKLATARRGAARLCAARLGTESRRLRPAGRANPRTAIAGAAACAERRDRRRPAANQPGGAGTGAWTGASRRAGRQPVAR